VHVLDRDAQGGQGRVPPDVLGAGQAADTDLLARQLRRRGDAAGGVDLVGRLRDLLYRDDVGDLLRVRLKELEAAAGAGDGRRAGRRATEAEVDGRAAGARRAARAAGGCRTAGATAAAAARGEQ